MHDLQKIGRSTHPHQQEDPAVRLIQLYTSATLAGSLLDCFRFFEFLQRKVLIWISIFEGAAFLVNEYNSGANQKRSWSQNWNDWGGWATNQLGRTLDLKYPWIGPTYITHNLIFSQDFGPCLHIQGPWSRLWSVEIVCFLLLSVGIALK